MEREKELSGGKAPEASLERIGKRMPWAGRGVGGGGWLHKLASILFSEDVSLRMFWLQVTENSTQTGSSRKEVGRQGNSGAG